MKRSPEKVSGRCARISIYIYISLSLSFRDRFEKAAAGIKSVESRDVTRIMRIVSSGRGRWLVPVS